MTAPRIQLIDAEKTFGAGPSATAAVRGVSLEVRPGEVFGVIGESGAGKSTLIRLINLLERPTGGRVLIDGEDVAGLDAAGLRTLRRRVGMIFQHFNLLTSKTVADNVAFPLRLEGRTAPVEIKARVAELLERVGLSDQAGKYPAQLSGGQKQRVGLARALACRPSILLCDEATSALDPETTGQVLDLIAGINHDLGLTILLITHEMEVVRRVCDRVAVMDEGRIVESGPVVDVFLDPQQAVTRRMLGADDELAPPATPSGRTLRLIYSGDAAAQPWLSRIARDTGVDYNLHSGRVGHIKGRAYGQLTVTLEGGDIPAALAAFETAGVTVREAR